MSQKSPQAKSATDSAFITAPETTNILSCNLFPALWMGKLHLKHPSCQNSAMARLKMCRAREWWKTTGFDLACRLDCNKPWHSASPSLWVSVVTCARERKVFEMQIEVHVQAPHKRKFHENPSVVQCFHPCGFPTSSPDFNVFEFYFSSPQNKCRCHPHLCGAPEQKDSFPGPLTTFSYTAGLARSVKQPALGSNISISLLAGDKAHPNISIPEEPRPEANFVHHLGPFHIFPIHLSPMVDFVDSTDLLAGWPNYIYIYSFVSLDCFQGQKHIGKCENPWFSGSDFPRKPIGSRSLAPSIRSSAGSELSPAPLIQLSDLSMSSFSMLSRSYYVCVYVCKHIYIYMCIHTV